MRTVADVYQKGMAIAQQQPPLDLTLAACAGCILAEDVRSPVDYPPRSTALVDGYAVRLEDLKGKPPGQGWSLIVTGEVVAGESDPPAHVTDSAVRVHAGAPLPSGADTVVKLEATDEGSARVTIYGRPTQGENVAAAGSDITRGEVILKKGARIGPPQIAAAAAIGRATLFVRPRPRVVVLPIGDALIEPGTPVKRGSVYDANGVALGAAAAEVGAETFRTPPVSENRLALRNMVEDQLMRADILITTGGLSGGTGSVVREVFTGLGEVQFEAVASSPASMVGVGNIGEGEDRTPVFCLPGDPVSAQVAFEVYVRPVLRRMMGWNSLNRPVVQARVDRNFASPAGIRDFVRVTLSGDPKKGYTARVLGDDGTAQLSGLAEANALAVVSEDTVEVRAGDVLTCILLEG